MFLLIVVNNYPSVIINIIQHENRRIFLKYNSMFKMKVQLFTIFIFLLGTVICEKYTTKYDNVDLDEILKSDRLLKSYVDCIMERGHCTPDGQELKKDIPDALKDDCANCSEKQKNGVIKVVKFLVKNKRAIFDELAAKYDPDGVYLKRHKADFEKEGIKI